MTRLTLEVADILRAQGDRFLDRYRSSFDFQHHKAFRAIQRCRIAALGGHVDACPQCGHRDIFYSCRNRHCQTRGNGDRSMKLSQLENMLDDSRLAKEDVFYRPLRTESEREWLRKNRTEDATHWNLLTNMRPEHLQYGN